MQETPMAVVASLACWLALAACGGDSSTTGPAGSLDMDLQLAGDVDIEADDKGGATGPQLAVDLNGIVTAVWSQLDGTRNSVYADRDSGSGAWGTPVLLETGDAGHTTQPQLAVELDGAVAVVWKQRDGTRDSIWSNRLE